MRTVRCASCGMATVVILRFLRPAIRWTLRAACQRQEELLQ